MNNLQALTIIWNALHDYRENSISEGEQANDRCVGRDHSRDGSDPRKSRHKSRRDRLIRSCLDAR
jgi:hypothetical protein